MALFTLNTFNWSEVGGDGMDNGVDAVNDNILYTSFIMEIFTGVIMEEVFSPINNLSPAGSKRLAI